MANPVPNVIYTTNPSAPIFEGPPAYTETVFSTPMGGNMNAPNQVGPTTNPSVPKTQRDVEMQPTGTTPIVLFQPTVQRVTVVQPRQRVSF